MEETVFATIIKDLSDALARAADRIEGAGPELAAAERVVHLPPLDRIPLGQAAALICLVRKARQNYFSGGLFHEPAWDMLLTLYAACHDRRVLQLSELAESTELSPTTAQRWIGTLQDRGLVNRQVNAVDRRCVRVWLTEKGYGAMSAYLREMSELIAKE